MTQSQLEARLKKLLKTRRLFGILSLSFLGVAVSFDIVVTILNYTVENLSEYVYWAMIEISTLFFAASIALFFVRIFAIDVKIRNTLYQLSLIVQPINNEKVIVTTDVKETPLDRPHQLVKQYEDLLKQGLITQDDFDKKKKEILGE